MEGTATHLRDLPALVVPSDECDAIGVAYFEGEKEEESLDAVEASVHKVAYGML